MHLLALTVGCAGVTAPSPVETPATELPGGDPVEGAVAGEYVYTLDDDAQALVRYEPYTGTVTSVALDAAPGRVAVAGNHLWVTLPQSREIAVFDVAGSPERVGTLETGAGPVGIAANADGTRLYVALSTSDEVVELDTAGTVLQRWDVEGQPTWLALHPDESALYVGSALGGTLTWIDLASGTSAPVALPEPYRPLVSEDAFVTIPVPLTPRITGDLSVSADGTQLAVPMLYVDNSTQVDAPDDDGMVENGYASSITILASRFNPTVTLVPLDGGEPGGDGHAVLATGMSADFTVLRSYITSASFSPDGSLVLAPMEGSSAVIVLSSDPRDGDLGGGFVRSRGTVVQVGGGPRRISFAGDGLAFVDCFLDRRIDAISLPEAYASFANTPMTTDVVLDGASLGASSLDEDVLAGRERFYSAIDTQMVASGAGVSCSTCHLNGRNDGLSWNLEDGARQTPSLAGGISASAPFTWASDVDTVADEVLITSEGRMGGEGLSDTEAEEVAAFIDSIPAPDVPGVGSTDPAVTRGEAVFSEAGCAACHRGALYTDNASWDMFGIEGVNTPSLRRVAATPPYLHDGRAATLRDVLELSRDGEMGDTSGLTDAQMDDLEAFLRSL